MGDHSVHARHGEKLRDKLEKVPRVGRKEKSQKIGLRQSEAEDKKGQSGETDDLPANKFSASQPPKEPCCVEKTILQGCKKVKKT